MTSSWIISIESNNDSQQALLSSLSTLMTSSVVMTWLWVMKTSSKIYLLSLLWHLRWSVEYEAPRQRDQISLCSHDFPRSYKEREAMTSSWVIVTSENVLRISLLLQNRKVIVIFLRKVLFLIVWKFLWTFYLLWKFLWTLHWPAIESSLGEKIHFFPAALTNITNKQIPNDDVIMTQYDANDDVMMSWWLIWKVL